MEISVARSGNVASSPVADRSGRRVVVAGAVGTLVENYDYAVYGVFVAPLTVAFLPSNSGPLGLLAALGIFGAAFVARPLGGVIFGSIGDRLGRRSALTMSILLMGVATFVIGILPTYQQIGLAAPILLIVCRLLQGVSAGGEFSSAAVFVAEYAPVRRRGLWTGALPAGGTLSLLAASGLALLLGSVFSAEAFQAYGWRIAFIIALPLSLVGLYLRLRTDESPIYKAARERLPEATRAPVLDVMRRNWRGILQVAGLVALQAGYYIVYVYLPSYLADTSDLSPQQTRLITFVIMLVLAILIILAAAWGDKVGRRLLFVLGGVGIVVLAIPSFLLASAGGFGTALLAGLFLVLVLAPALGNLPAFQAEAFPTDVRASGAGIGYNVGTIIFAGAGPYLAASLVTSTGSSLSPAFLMMGMGLIGLVAALTLGKTRHLRLEDVHSGAATPQVAESGRGHC
jgi:MHS family proline/betaine transporter-like MFS transporter